MYPKIKRVRVHFWLILNGQEAKYIFIRSEMDPIIEDKIPSLIQITRAIQNAKRKVINKITNVTERDRRIGGNSYLL